MKILLDRILPKNLLVLLIFGLCIACLVGITILHTTGFFILDQTGAISGGLNRIIHLEFEDDFYFAYQVGMIALALVIIYNLRAGQLDFQSNSLVPRSPPPKRFK